MNKLEALMANRYQRTALTSNITGTNFVVYWKDVLALLGALFATFGFVGLYTAITRNELPISSTDLSMLCLAIFPAFWANMWNHAQVDQQGRYWLVNVLSLLFVITISLSSLAMWFVIIFQLRELSPPLSIATGFFINPWTIIMQYMIAAVLWLPTFTVTDLTKGGKSYSSAHYLRTPFIGKTIRYTAL